MPTNPNSSWTGAGALEDFFQGAPCGLVSSANDGTILCVNDTFLAWTGYERRALTGGCHLDELLTRPSRLYYETHFGPLLHIQGYVHEVALDVRRPDGTTLPVLLNAVLDDGPGAAIRFAVFAARDRRAYERELLLERRHSEQAVQAKADFLAMFAHEIRNPLAAVLLEAEQLEHSTEQTLTESAVTPLRESLDRVLGLLNNMLDISKLDAGKLTLQNTEFAIGDVLQAVVHTLRPLADVRAVALSTHVDTTLRRRVIGDPVKLDQALTNLVSNAIKFTDAGSVTLRAACSERRRQRVRVRFEVIDTGIGIAAEHLERIFNAYEQADPSIGPRFGGSGLGLTITRKLVELQAGELTVTSEPGRGSTFMFELWFEWA